MRIGFMVIVSFVSLVVPRCGGLGHDRDPAWRRPGRRI